MCMRHTLPVAIRSTFLTYNIDYFAYDPHTSTSIHIYIFITYALRNFIIIHVKYTLGLCTLCRVNVCRSTAFSSLHLNE